MLLIRVPNTNSLSKELVGNSQKVSGDEFFTAFALQSCLVFAVLKADIPEGASSSFIWLLEDIFITSVMLVTPLLSEKMPALLSWSTVIISGRVISFSVWARMTARGFSIQLRQFWVLDADNLWDCSYSTILPCVHHHSRS